MVVGNGLLAKAFNAYKQNELILIFASGVSNSLETDEREFQKEKDLLSESIKSNPDKTLVYFSTCSIEDVAVAKRRYTVHKLEMEKIVKAGAKKYLIFRLSNIVGEGGNKNTIFNYLVNSIKTKSKLTVWENASRNILDIDDVVKIITDCISNKVENKTINVANINAFPVLDVISRIENYFDTKANIIIENKGAEVIINVDEIKDSILMLNKDFSINYVDYLLNKYH